MENQEQNDSLEKMIDFLSQIENKNQTLVEVINDLVDKKLNNAEILTEKLIQQEINQNILLIKNLKKYKLYSKTYLPNYIII